MTEIVGALSDTRRETIDCNNGPKFGALESKFGWFDDGIGWLFSCSVGNGFWRLDSIVGLVSVDLNSKFCWLIGENGWTLSCSEANRFEGFDCNCDLRSGDVISKFGSLVLINICGLDVWGKEFDGIDSNWGLKSEARDSMFGRLGLKNVIKLSDVCEGLDSDSGLMSEALESIFGWFVGKSVNILSGVWSKGMGGIDSNCDLNSGVLDSKFGVWDKMLGELESIVEDWDESAFLCCCNSFSEELSLDSATSGSPKLKTWSLSLNWPLNGTISKRLGINESISDKSIVALIEVDVNNTKNNENWIKCKFIVKF